MQTWKSTRSYSDFFKQSGYRNYARYKDDPKAKRVFDWLQEKIDLLISSIRNHEHPALQGVIVNLDEEILQKEFDWSKEHREGFFISMIGSMVKYLVEEFGFVPFKSGVRLKNSNVIKTASKYRKMTEEEKSKYEMENKVEL